MIHPLLGTLIVAALVPALSIGMAVSTAHCSGEAFTCWLNGLRFLSVAPIGLAFFILLPAIVAFFVGVFLLRLPPVLAIAGAAASVGGIVFLLYWGPS